MAELTKIKLSGSTSGKPIKVVATSTPGTTIHTATSGTTATAFDWPKLFAFNHHTTTATLTIEWGGTTSPDDLMVNALEFPAKWGCWLPKGWCLQGGLVIKAFASVANVFTIGGSALRTT